MVLTARFREALVFASQLHAAQARKQVDAPGAVAVPYVAHLLAVAALVLEHGADEDEAIAALLHDAIEDQGGELTRQRIRGLFGERVVAIVDGCTDAEGQPKPAWEERKRKHVASVCLAEESVRLVTAADKLHNARSVLSDYLRFGEASWARFRGGRAGTLWYYRAMAEALKQVPCPRVEPLVLELDRVVTELEQAAAASA
jgi:(p)ppGpp synthase/HD superfamily hydrolase